MARLARPWLAALAFALTACAAPWARAVDLVIGSGRLQTEARHPGRFDAIELAGPMSLVLRQGAQERVEVSADDNLLPLVETRVAAQAGLATLTIAGRRGSAWRTALPITVTVDLVGLKALTLSSSGDAKAERLHADALTVAASGSGDFALGTFEGGALVLRLDGSGDVRIAGGRARRLDATLAGSGNVDAARLECDDATVAISGSGDARVHARRTLNATLSGSGDVVYGGDPKVTRDISGSGEVKRQR